MRTSTNKWRTTGRTTAVLLLVVVLILSFAGSASAWFQELQSGETPPVPSSPMDAVIALVSAGDAAGFVVPEESSPSGATIASEYPDYAPGATVTLIGTGWASGEAVHIFVNDDAGQTWTHDSNPDPVADVNGSFTYSFDLPTWFVATYSVVATGPVSGVATTTFTDVNIGTYDQCANDDGDGYGGNPGTCSWVNGNLQRNNSTYNEGDATVQRAWLTDLVPGSSHSITFKYGTTKGGRHAYDYLTTWNWSENWITLNDLCRAPTGTGLISGCNTAAQMTYAIPDDPNVPNSIEPIGGAGRLFTIAGGTITAVSTPSVASGDYTGDSETVITVNYTVGPNSGSMCSVKQGVTTCGVMFWFGAHVAMTAEWMAYNGTTGASTVSGSPYHVALDQVDGAAVGQRDNQMQANAVPLNGMIVVVKDAIPDDAQDFSFNLTNGDTFDQDFLLDDDADGTLPNSMSFSLPAGTYLASELFPLPVGWTYSNLVCSVVGTNGSSYSVDLANAQATITLVTGFNTSDTVTCTYTDTKGLALTATKTAAGSYDRTVTWTLEKSVSPASHTGYAGQTTDSSTWTVVATKSELPGNYMVQGTITINNPNNWAVPFTVSDTLSDGTVATVSCPSSSVSALGSLVCNYTAKPGDGSATSNTALITSGDPNVDGTSASQDITWTENPPIGYDSGTLTDPRFAGAPWNYAGETISGTTTKTFDENFSCPADVSLYANGAYQYPETNWAYLDGNIDLEASAEVGITCHLPALQVSKTAAGEWDRTVTWTLAKSVDPASHEGYAGDTFDSTWTVVADKTDSGPFNFLVAGQISIYNPAAIAQDFSISDELSDGTVAAVDCDPLTEGNQASGTVPAGGTVNCTYTASPADDSAKSNTATVSATGNADQTANADVGWTENLTGSDDGNLTDPRFDYDEIVSGSTTETFKETFTCSSNPADYTDGSYTDSFTNDAYFMNVDHDLHADAQVGITCHLPALQAGKTAAGEWDRTVTWTLAKSVDDDSHSGFAGDSFESTWTIVADKTDSGRGNFVVAGTISIHNPAAIAQSFSVSDVLSDGTVAAVDCDPLTEGNQASGTVPAGGTVTCTYSVSPADDTAKSNTATVSAAGNADQTASDPIEWSENLDGYDSGDLADPRFSYSETISGDTTETFPDTFECSTDPDDYTDGSYSYKVTNVATLDSSIGLEASADVDVTCYWPASAKVIKTTTEGSEDIGEVPFTFKLYNPDGDLVETDTLNAAGEVAFAAELKTEGTWKVVEVLPIGWVTDDNLTCEIAIAYPGSEGQTYTCNFDNTEMSRVTVLKLTQGVIANTTPPVWTFRIFTGPDGYKTGTELAKDTTPPGQLDFGSLNLDPNEQYTLCETNVAAGWTSSWKVDTDGDGVADTIINPYNPDYDPDPAKSQDLGNRCVEIGAGTELLLTPGETLVLQVDNSYPGGEPRTPGYWKNWNACTPGGQYANAMANGGGAGGFWTLDELLNSPAFYIGDMYLDGIWGNDPFKFDSPNHNDCVEAVRILDKSDAKTAKKMANDAAYELATALFAAKLNLAAGAETCATVQQGVMDGQTLLDTINFTGTGAYLGPTVKGTKLTQRNQALGLATTLDQYNNGLLCTP